ncbi:putative methyltransferase DDB_G0268948 isoform X7 [Portunus trituberculatus]|nr:putative methyltransferase DDB_G0268948 isoform X7 [Portunus trituberculatus]XP_045138426.1 putative methyltransferase DDB_G0268948 isoform X7 [Portunus trituberculatus]XP_045138427.1 putative methyltransferase DDB_G0268948 isoform X7 [Portunus trituberculatus]XP_045138428.1 putative methyltransferase DDB_G0268948 isoform X7 [Portunus trituberculatus]
MANRFFEGAAHAAAYARFRPHPPQSLIDNILSFLKSKYTGALAAAADVGCGSGQTTWILAPHFNNVTGLDISEAQITEAIKKNKANNVSFKVSGAEKLPFPSQSLQVITTGQACHWFDLPKFYAEVDRVLVPGGVVALYGYLFPLPIFGEVSDQLAEIVNDTYKNKLKGYIQQGSMEVYLENYKSEKYSMAHYEDNIEIRNDSHYTDRDVSVTDLTGYISSWSGFQNYRAQNGDKAASDMLQNFQNRIMSVLGVSTAPEDTQLTLRYKYFIIMGRKP